jgi:hypothetical protein
MKKLSTSEKISQLIAANPNIKGMAAHSFLYSALSPINARQRFALALGRKQNQRQEKHWPTFSQPVSGLLKPQA